MSRADLTRWNRAGRPRIDYVDGNAATYLELLRQALARAFDPGGGGTAPTWSELVERWPAAAHEDPGRRESRLLAQYHDARRDHAWEILRAFARSTHVLTAHLDAYANESLLGTATQWDSLRKLVALLDARPTPPASARTDLAIHAKAAGPLAAGFQVKHQPGDDGAPAIFETARDLELDPRLNALRPRAWNRSQDMFRIFPTTLFPDFPLAPEAPRPAPGEIGVLLIHGDGQSNPEPGYGARISRVGDADIGLDLRSQAVGLFTSVEAWRMRLDLQADRVVRPRLAGPGTVVLTSTEGLAAGRSAVAFPSGVHWRTARVEAIDGDRVRLSDWHVPAEGDPVYALVRAQGQLVDGVQRVVLPAQRGAGGRVWDGDLQATGNIAQVFPSEHVYSPTPLYEYVPNADEALYVPASADPAARSLGPPPDDLVFAGRLKDLSVGDWMVSSGTDLEAGRVARVETLEDQTRVATDPPILDRTSPIHFGFKRTLRPRGHDRNTRPAFDPAARSDRATRLVLDPADVQPPLAVGRRVLVSDGTTVHAGTLAAVDALAGTVAVTPPVPGTTPSDPDDPSLLPRWRTVVHANVVRADHGERQPRRILGSGDATRDNQRFELAVDALSYVADPTMPAGVRAAVEVQVDARVWTQVANLRDSGPTDPHYETRITEQGRTEIRFGDGRHGRRLPSGTDNVRVNWRKGTGAAGNLPPASLSKPVRPDPRVESVAQPGPAAGGAEMQGVASLRETATAGLLTLDRAVSVRDFANLAAQHSGVLQAHAVRATAGAARGERVRVIVVPAGGRASGTLLQDLRSFLTARTTPGVTVEVRSYTPLPLALDATIRVNPDAYEPEAVKARVEAALIAAYRLEAARLGAPLFRSQLLHLIDRVEGVESSHVAIDVSGYPAPPDGPTVARSSGGEVRGVQPAPGQMIHHDPASSRLAVTVEEAAAAR